MTIKTLSAAAIVTATLSGLAFASPAFAQSAHLREPSNRGPAHALRHFRGVYNQVPVNGPAYSAPGYDWSADRFGRDPSRVGGVDPDLSPSGS
jgi:hypothetical protein